MSANYWDYTSSSIPYVRVSGPGALGNMDRLKLLFFWKRLYNNNKCMTVMWLRLGFYVQEGTLLTK